MYDVHSSIKLALFVSIYTLKNRIDYLEHLSLKVVGELAE
jgi:hypothetical protein